MCDSASSLEEIEQTGILQFILNRGPKKPAKKVHPKANELDFRFDTPLDLSYGSKSLLDLWSSVQAQRYLTNERDFSPAGTPIDCLRINEDSSEWDSLDDKSLHRLLEQSTVPSSTNYPTQRQLRVFFIPFKSTKDWEEWKSTSFDVQPNISPAGTKILFDALQLDPSFVMNLVGQWDYSAPRKTIRYSSNGSISCDLSLQYFRWNLRSRGRPISVYMHFEAKSNSTYYVITHKEGDTIINALRDLLERNRNCSVLFDNPMEIHVLILRLSLSVFQYHVRHFHDLMWTHFEKINEAVHPDSILKERQVLIEHTENLQDISYSAESHITHATIASRNAKAISQIHQKIRNWQKSPASSHAENPGKSYRAQVIEETLEYVPESMETQKIWLAGWKKRRDTVNDLVFNLVTQQDATNNMHTAEQMKRDTSSMHAITVLAMVFLPGTFTATVLGAGIFSAVAHSHAEIHVAGLWWFWLAVTLPLTLGVLLAWYIYHKVRKPKTAFQAR